MSAPARVAADAINDGEAARLITYEARLLDEQRYEEWMGLFAADGYYWAPARWDQPDPYSEVSLIFDDREIMQQRIRRLKHPRVHAQLPPSRAVRQVSNTSREPGEACEDRMVFRSVFFMREFRPCLPEPVDRTFAGEYRHCLRRTASGLVIAWKTARLVNCEATFTPIFLYF